MTNKRVKRREGPTESELYRSWLDRSLRDPELAERLRRIVEQLLGDAGKGWSASWAEFERAVPATSLPDHIREIIFFRIFSTVALELEHGPVLDLGPADEPVERDWVGELVEELRRAHIGAPAADLLVPCGHEAGWIFSDFPIVRSWIPLEELGAATLGELEELCRGRKGVRGLEEERQRGRAAMYGAAPGGPDPTTFKPRIPHPRTRKRFRLLTIANRVRELHEEHGWKRLVEAWADGRRGTNKEIAEELAARDKSLDAHNLEADLSKLRRIARKVSEMGFPEILDADPQWLPIARVLQSVMQWHTKAQAPRKPGRSRRSRPSKPKRSR